MDNQTNTFVLNLIEQAVQHVVLRVVEKLGTTIDARINAKLDEVLHDVRHTLTELDAKVTKLGKFTDSDEFTGLVRQLVSDTMDDDCTITRFDKAIDDLTERIDSLEDEDGSNISQKLKTAIVNIAQDTIDASKFVAKDDLESEVTDLINRGSFSVSFSQY